MPVKSNLPRGGRPAPRQPPYLLLLAAGRSRRLGRPKGAVVARGVPLLVQQLQTAQAAGMERALVVLGASAPRLEKLLPPTVQLALGFRELRVFRARNWREGMGGSLRDGLRALPAGHRQVLVLLVDQTGIRAGHLRQLARAGSRGRIAATTTATTAMPELSSGMSPGTASGTPMAPVVLPRARLADAITSLRGDRGLGPWLRQLRARDWVGIPCPAATEDLDTAADAAAWRAKRR